MTINYEEKIRHKISEVICIRCKKRWLAVRPEFTKLKELQCPKCKKRGYVIETGEELEGVSQ